MQTSANSAQLSRFWNNNTGASAHSIVRIASNANNANSTRLEFSDSQYYHGTISSDRSQGIVFRTSATGTNPLTIPERMRITSAGNVGIGATSSNTFGGASKLFVDIGTGQGSIRLQNGNTDGVYFRRHTSGGNYQFQTYSSTNNTGVLSLQPFGGNVGIGNTSPSSKLHVTGDTYISGQFGQGVATANKLTNYGAEFRTSGASAQIFFGRDGNNIGTGGIGADLTYVLRVWKSDFSQPFVIKQTGEVGIGTTSPTAPLDVLGVRAGRGWAINDRANIRLDSNGTGVPADILFGHTAAANQTSWTGVLLGVKF